MIHIVHHQCPRTAHKTSESHDMHMVLFSANHVCNGCQRHIPEREAGARCQACDYDLCSICIKSVKPTEQNPTGRVLQPTVPPIDPNKPPPSAPPVGSAKYVNKLKL